ncbi:MAG: PAS domain S-box protein [Ignavibacteria bacterium]|nr:PAS domain S-box protein [Ignavibacteria bacterium]
MKKAKTATKKSKEIKNVKTKSVKSSKPNEASFDFIQYSSEAIIQINSRGIIKSWQGAASKIFGFTEKQILDKHIGALISEYERGRNEIVRAIISEKNLTNYETRLLTKSGVEIYANVSMLAYKQKKRKTNDYILIVRDITEEKNFRDRLFTLQNAHSEIIDGMLMGMLILDKETAEIIFMNKRGMEMFQLTGKENIGRKIWDLVDPDLVSEVNDLISSDVEFYTQLPKQLKVHRYRDKTKFWIDVYASRIIFHKRPSSLFLFFDNSELRDHVKKLEETVKQKDLQAATKSRFMANMSHELRSPINIILGYVDILISLEVDAEVKEFLIYIQKSAEHLLKTLNDILDLSKAEASKIKLIEKPYNIVTLMKSVLSMIEVKLIGKKVALDYNSNIEPDSYFSIDAHNLQRVLLNVLDNAVKFTDEGLISVDVKYRNKTLNFSISDTGIGMTQEELDRLFTPFEQAHWEISQKYGGSGLGLAISKEICALWKGEIKIESKKNAGTTVTFTYPAERAEQIEEAEVSELPKDLSIIKGKKVLVIDDQEYNHKLFKLMLSECDVETVFSGKLALNKLITEDFDGIVLDLRLPDIAGMDVIKEIKKRERLKDLKIVTTSADILSGLKEEIEEMGLVFIPKPVRRADLLNALITAFSK